MWFDRRSEKRQRRSAADYIEVNPFGAERIDLVDMARSQEGHEMLQRINENRDYLRTLVHPGEAPRPTRPLPDATDN